MVRYNFLSSSLKFSTICSIGGVYVHFRHSLTAFSLGNYRNLNNLEILSKKLICTTSSWLSFPATEVEIILCPHKGKVTICHFVTELGLLSQPMLSQVCEHCRLPLYDRIERERTHFFCGMFLFALTLLAYLANRSKSLFKMLSTSGLTPDAKGERMSGTS